MPQKRSAGKEDLQELHSGSVPELQEIVKLLEEIRNELKEGDSASPHYN